MSVADLAVLGALWALGAGGALVVLVALESRRAPTDDLSLTDRVGKVVRPRLPVVVSDGLAARLVAAGEDPARRLDAAVGLRLLTAAAGILVALATAVGVATGVLPALGGTTPGTLLGLAAGAVVALLPEVRLRHRIDARRVSLRRDLPRHLDLLTICVEAGLGFDQALERVVRVAPGELADEFARMAAEIRAGRPRTDALRSLAERCPIPEIRSFALAMVQADTFGVAVGSLLRTQASETRHRQRQDAQLRAQRAPVAMLAPMVLCIFPALLVVVAGPALLSVRDLFGA